MESPRDDVAAQLAAAERVRQGFATDLRLPAGFHVLLGLATAVLTASIALDAGGTGGRTGAVASIVGVVLFLVTAGYLVARFRAVNGAHVDGLLARAIFGTTGEASIAFCLPLALATWSAAEGLTWLAVLLSVVGGVAYAGCAQRWWAAYRRDPVGHTEGESTLVLTIVLVAVAVGGLVLVVVSSR
jgi:hypothetical protein